MPQPSARRLILSLTMHQVGASHGYILLIVLCDREKKSMKARLHTTTAMVECGSSSTFNHNYYFSSLSFLIVFVYITTTIVDEWICSQQSFLPLVQFAKWTQTLSWNLLERLCKSNYLLPNPLPYIWHWSSLLVPHSNYKQYRAKESKPPTLHWPM